MQSSLCTLVAELMRRSENMSDSPSFYQQLAGFSDFESLAHDHVFHPVPANWYVVISDIEGSTQAISEGRYRDVNMLGAASVAVVQSLFAGESFPFVFGGDGATFLIPPHKIADVRNALAGLMTHAQTHFELGLRVGVMPVAEIYRTGKSLEVAKFEIAHGKCTAFIRGGGVSWAESQIKNPKLGLCIKPQAASDLSVLSGLSCRWQPLAAQNGAMLAILIQPRMRGHEANKLLANVLEKFAQVLGGSISAARPVDLENMKYKGFWSCLRDEWGMNPRLLSKAFVKRTLEILLCVSTFRWKWRELWPAAGYHATIPTHSDYRKYDDVLRLILDCSLAQADEIRAYLEACHRLGSLFYGTHASSHALMTCFVESIKPGEHIHFIDGFDGGYTLAAKQLKQQVMLSRRDILPAKVG